MKRKLSISKLLIAVFFLCIYGNVLFTQLLCNFSHLLESADVPHSHALGHDHHHGYETPPFSDHTHDDAHSHDESSPEDEGGCCNELTSGFFKHQTLVSNASVNNLVKLLFAQPPAAEPDFLNVFSFFNSKGFASSKSPPPKIPDIRVFIQSFLI